ncbi:MAG: tetratricopeptide repeat protein [Paludibacteraceae bacterium]|nr:tetratricopeptide repeat protein [Paludibacteraceae bacterium]
MKKFLFMFVAVLVAATSYAQEVPQDSISDYELGIDLISDARYEEGIDCLNKEVRKDPTNGNAILWIAYARYELDQYDKALIAADNAIRFISKKEVETKAYAHSLRAKIYMGLGDTKATLKDYTAAIKLSEDPTYFCQRGEFYYLLQDLNNSTKDYLCAMALDTENRVPYMGLGRNFLFTEDYDMALDMFSRVVEKFPSYSEAYVFRAKTFIALDKYEEALDDILKAIDIDNNYKAIDLLAEHYVENENMDMLFSKIQLLQETESYNANWFYLAGLLKEEKEMYAEAISDFKNAEKLDLQNPSIDVQIAICCMSLGDYANAINCINKVMAVDSTHLFDHIFQRAICYSQLGDYANAIADIDKYIEKYPEFANAYYRRGLYKFFSGQYEAAVEDHSTAIALEDSVAAYYDGRARAYLALGKQAEAQADCEKILTIDTEPDGGSAAMFAYHFLGNDSLAIEFALADMAINPKASYNVACTYALANDLENAILYLRKAFEEGFVMLHHLSVDQDMDNIRHTPEFQALVEEYTRKIQEKWPVSILKQEPTLPNSTNGYPTWAETIL